MSGVGDERRREVERRREEKPADCCGGEFGGKGRGGEAAEGTR